MAVIDSIPEICLCNGHQVCDVLQTSAGSVLLIHPDMLKIFLILMLLMANLAVAK